jgi:hypothetical protein
VKSKIASIEMAAEKEKMAADFYAKLDQLKDSLEDLKTTGKNATADVTNSMEKLVTDIRNQINKVTN